MLGNIERAYRRIPATKIFAMTNMSESEFQPSKPFKLTPVAEKRNWGREDGDFAIPEPPKSALNPLTLETQPPIDANSLQMLMEHVTFLQDI